jgi:hypothetical protein
MPFVVVQHPVQPTESGAYLLFTPSEASAIHI